MSQFKGQAPRTKNNIVSPILEKAKDTITEFYQLADTVCCGRTAGLWVYLPSLESGFLRFAGSHSSECVASRPSIEGDTNEDSKEVKTDTLTLQATPLANGYVKAKTGTNTSDDVYNKWYEKVYEPQAEASGVVTEETDPQG